MLKSVPFLRLSKKAFGELSSQVQRTGGEDFKRGTPVEAFAWTKVEQADELGNIALWYRRHIGKLG